MSVRAGTIVVELEWPEASAGGDGHSAPPSAALSSATVAVLVTGSDPVIREDDGLFFIRAPTVGTFYRAPEPGARPFASEGDIVQPGQQIGILEAMKMMLPVEANRAGRVAEFLVKAGTPVEFDTPLITLTEVY